MILVRDARLRVNLVYTFMFVLWRVNRDINCNYIFSITRDPSVGHVVSFNV